MQTNVEEDRSANAKRNAKAHLRDILVGILAMREHQAKGNDDEADATLETLRDMPLSIQVRNGWYEPGDPKSAVLEEYKILLSTGGPACQIVGEMNVFGEPANATIQYQDWFTPWHDLETNEDEDEALLEFARLFYFSTE